VLAVKLTALESGCISFTLRPEIPYLQPFGESGRLGESGTVAACGQTITLSGEMEHYGISYEGQIIVQHSGGALCCDGNKLVLENADEAIIWMALGTNYRLCEEVFRDCPPQEKLVGNPHPHERISQTLAKALALGYDNVRERHVQDYQQFFNRVQLNLGCQPSNLPTDELLNAYIADKPSRYLEELYFQYGRYLLIASSRKGTLPGNLQGLWNQYYSTPWSGGYWHNINIQMNYWHAFTTNLAEMFESYSDMNLAFRKRAQAFADDYLKLIYEKHPNAKYAVPAKESGTGQNGWAIGTGSWPCHLSMPWPEGHSGPGQGGLITKLFWDYYDYTRDEAVLKDITYPALCGMSDFLSRTVIEQDGCLLVHPSMSPEQRKDGVHYRTTGCAFDQQMLYENHKDCIAAAQLLGIDNDTVRLAKQQIDKLEPVIVGASGQVKEYREEEYYGDIGEYHHRHISYLVALSPGQTIKPNTPEWMQAARVTLTERGDESTGWAMAHRLNAWARARDGQRAYKLYQTLLKTGTLPNLWALIRRSKLTGISAAPQAWPKCCCKAIAT